HPSVLSSIASNFLPRRDFTVEVLPARPGPTSISLARIRGPQIESSPVSTRVSAVRTGRSCKSKSEISVESILVTRRETHMEVSIILRQADHLDGSLQPKDKKSLFELFSLEICRMDA